MPGIAATRIEEAYFMMAQNPTGDLVFYGWLDNVDPITPASTEMNLTNLPSQNTPIALRSSRAKITDPYELQASYVSRSTSTLIYATFKCGGGVDTNTGCSNPAEKDLGISQDEFSAAAGLALLTLDDKQVIAYSVAPNGTVLESSDLAGLDVHTNIVSKAATAHPASPIAAFELKAQRWIFWFSGARKLQGVMFNTTSNAWAQVLDLPVQNTPSELPRSLAAIGSADQNTIQLFWLDGVEIRETIYENDKWRDVYLFEEIGTGTAGSGNTRSTTTRPELMNAHFAAVGDIDGDYDRSTQLFYGPYGTFGRISKQIRSDNGTWTYGGDVDGL